MWLRCDKESTGCAQVDNQDFGVAVSNLNPFMNSIQTQGAVFWFGLCFQAREVSLRVDKGDLDECRILDFPIFMTTITF